MPKKSLFSAMALSGLALAALCEPALARGYGMGSSLPLLDDIVEWIGFRELAGDRRDLFGYCLIGFAGAFGYLTNLAFEERGFGKVLNGVLGVAGVCLALHYAGPYLERLADASDKTRFNLTMIVAGDGAAVALFFGAFLKGFVLHFLHHGLDRLSRPAPPPKIAPPPEPTIAAAMRKEFGEAPAGAKLSLPALVTRLLPHIANLRHEAPAEHMDAQAVAARVGPRQLPQA